MVQQASVVNGWGQVKPRRTITLPSGSTVVVQDLDLEVLLETGILDHVDAFTKELSVKEKREAKKEGLTDEQALEMRFLKDKERFGKMIAMVNDAVSRSVVEPRISLLAEGAAEEEGKIYAHLVPLDDRFAIFDEVCPDMGDAFPDSEEPESAVAAVGNVEELQDNSV